MRAEGQEEHQPFLASTSMTRQEWSNSLLDRYKQYAVRVLRLCARLSVTNEARMIARQLMRSGTSPGAQYSEARRAKSRPDFISKIEGALQELDETLYWLDLLALANIVPSARLQELHAETNELIAILVTIARNTKAGGTA